MGQEKANTQVPVKGEVFAFWLRNIPPQRDLAKAVTKRYLLTLPTGRQADIRIMILINQSL